MLSSIRHLFQGNSYHKTVRQEDTYVWNIYWVYKIFEDSFLQLQSVGLI